MDDDWIETNYAFWDERAPLHEASDFYDLDDFRRRPDRLRPYELDDIGDVAGRTLVHLQARAPRRRPLRPACGAAPSPARVDAPGRQPAG